MPDLFGDEAVSASGTVMKKPVTNFAASVRDRLLEDTKRKRGNFQLTLRRYLVERFLYRLGQSRHREHFVLKGAMLFVLWDTSIDRPTKDLDLAGFWTNDLDSLLAAIREILVISCPEDGVTFASDTVTARSATRPSTTGSEFGWSARSQRRGSPSRSTSGSATRSYRPRCSRRIPSCSTHQRRGSAHTPAKCRLGLTRFRGYRIKTHSLVA